MSLRTITSTTPDGPEVLLRAAVDQGAVAHRVRAGHELAAGVDDQVRVLRPGRQAMAVHGLVRADVEIVGAVGHLPLARRRGMIEVARLAAGDDVDLAEFLAERRRPSCSTRR